MQPLAAEDPPAVGPYRLLRRLGAGGMGRVYLAVSDRDGRTVALKRVHGHFAVDEVFRHRFRREVDAARRVGGRWTAPVLDAGPEEDAPWVATGYVAGPPLEEAVHGHGRLPDRTVRALGAGLAEALQHVHGLGLVHRDLKPSNVLLTPEGPRLIDFGIVRAADASTAITTTGVAIGSPGYMSPEQALGQSEVDGASDVFSLGAVLAYAARGRPPFTATSSASLLYQVVHEEPELTDLDPALLPLVAACLAKEPAERPAPAEIADGLAAGAAAHTLVGAGWLPPQVAAMAARQSEEVQRAVAEPVPAYEAAGPYDPGYWPPEPAEDDPDGTGGEASRPGLGGFLSRYGTAVIGTVLVLVAIGLGIAVGTVMYGGGR